MFFTMHPVVWSAALVIAVACCGCAPSEPSAANGLHWSGETMGTTYHVKVRSLPKGEDAGKLSEEVDECLQKVDQQMSTYLRASELSRFNQLQTTDWFDVSPEVATVMKLALEISDKSDGAFDITVGPLVNLWSFGPDARPRQIPSQEAISAALAAVDYRQLEVRQSPPAIRKANPAIYVDLSAVAKGFAVDQAARLLESRGVTDYMVEVGGEVRTRGHKADGSRWRIGIERPLTTARVLELVVEPGDRALATSGDYRNFFEQDGKLYSHTIDPHTGRPVDHGLASVSVIADDCMTADAWATALMVLGPDRGSACAEANGLDVLMILRNTDGFVERSTPGFRKHIVP